jgi:gas vesicle protein
MKSDQTTNVLLGIIATGVAAMAAIAFEKRYHRQLCNMADQADDAMDHAYDRISHRTQEIGRSVRQEAGALRDRIEDGVETLREKAGNLKEKVSDSLERAGGQVRAGAEKAKEGLKQGVETVKEEVRDADNVAHQAIPAPPRI